VSVGSGQLAQRFAFFVSYAAALSQLPYPTAIEGCSALNNCPPHNPTNQHPSPAKTSPCPTNTTVPTAPPAPSYRLTLPVAGSTYPSSLPSGSDLTRLHHTTQPLKPQPKKNPSGHANTTHTTISSPEGG
jgi:hypothetical protein